MNASLVQSSAQSPPQGFAQSYAEARAKFLAAAAARGLAVESHPHPLPGRDGEPLAMDVVRDGPADAPALLLVTSACHGVEGYCGSGIQNALLADPSLAQPGVAILHVHALNPWGFSWCRRTTHENVDLNRNWHDFSKDLPANDAYDTLAHLFVPPTWPAPEADATLLRHAAEHGQRALQTALSSGQHRHADGLFYGGTEATWSQRTLRTVLRTHATHCDRLAWIDLHTGLGPAGHGERIAAMRDDAAAMTRARAWWGPEVTSIYDGSSASSLLRGLMFEAAYDECAQAEYTGIALEYGTVPWLDVTNALRADQWLANHPDTPAAQRDAIKRQVRDAFYVDDDGWKQRVVEQGLQAVRQGLSGLSATR